MAESTALAKGTNPGVAPNGYCAEGLAPSGVTWEEHNIDCFGFTCPREHFIYGPPDWSAYKIAKVWGITPSMVCRWSSGNNWEVLRRRYRVTMPADEGGLVESDELQARREAWIQRKLDMAEGALEKIADTLHSGTEDVLSPETGMVVGTQRLTAFSQKALSQSAKEWIEIGNVSLGLPNKIADKGDKEDGGGKTISKIVFVMSGQQKALPEAVEGEIADAEPVL